MGSDMLRRIAFGIGLLSATLMSAPALSQGSGTLQIIVSKDKQSLTVYDGDVVVATSKVSTGKAGHTTPSGIFSILEKRKYHESNIYSNAPMPWMQRLTWSGIALHESNSVPSYPASHGCVRMPAAFAKSLYQMTQRGAHVIITDAPVVPQRLTNVGLLRPRKPLPSGPLLSDVDLRASAIDVSKPAELAMNIVSDNPAIRHFPTAGGDRSAAPLRILITRRGDRETLMDAQTLLQELGFETGGVDGFAGPLTRSAIAGFKRWKGLSPNGPLVSRDFLNALYQAAGRPQPPAGQIMVRQNFEPLFEAPVVIKEPEAMLGTHLLTVDKIDRETETAEWRGVTLPNELSAATRQRLGIQTVSEGAADINRTLARIEIPADIREQIETMLIDGTSITINDDGLGAETGKGTDFVTITKSEPQVAQNRPSAAKPERVRQARSKPSTLSIGLY